MTVLKCFGECQTRTVTVRHPQTPGKIKMYDERKRKGSTPNIVLG